MSQIAEDGEQQTEASDRGNDGKPKTALEFVVKSDDLKRGILRELQGELYMLKHRFQSSSNRFFVSRALIRDRRGHGIPTKSFPSHSIFKAARQP